MYASYNIGCHPLKIKPIQTLIHKSLIVKYIYNQNLTLLLMRVWFSGHRTIGKYYTSIYNN